MIASFAAYTSISVQRISMHKFRLQTWLFSLLVLLDCSSAVIRPTASLNLIDGEGFVAYLEVPKSFGAIENCWFKYRDTEKIRIELNTSVTIITERGEEVLPFSMNICGIRVRKISTATAATWTLEAENIYGDFEQDHLSINILPPVKKRFDTRVQMSIGEGTIACTTHATYTKHCKIIDMVGEVWNGCSLYTTIRSNQTYECLAYNWGRMDESYEQIIVDIKNSSMYSTATLEESESNLVLRCQFEDKLYSCQAEMPDHKHELYIMEGLYNGRYSAYDTILSKSKCALEIPKPLLENEVGLWRLLNYETSIASGCLFYIGKDKKDIIETELKNLEKVQELKVYDTDQNIEEISCSVPFVVDDCYLRTPNNTVYFPESIHFQRSRMYGKCVFQRMPIIAGVWTCGARGHDYEKEVLQDIEVIVKSKAGEVLTEKLKIRRSSAVEFMCKTAFEEPISHCAFVDPQSRVHLVATAHSIKAAGHVHYYGRGLQWGECGAKIDRVNADDYGEWMCQFIRNGIRSTFVLELKESVLGHATTIGLGIGVTIIIVLVMGVVIGTVFYRRRNLSAQHNFTSADPLDNTSGTSMQMHEVLESRRSVEES